MKPRFYYYTKDHLLIPCGIVLASVLGLTACSENENRGRVLANEMKHECRIRYQGDRISVEDGKAQWDLRLVEGEYFDGKEVFLSNRREICVVDSVENLFSDCRRGTCIRKVDENMFVTEFFELRNGEKDIVSAWYYDREYRILKIVQKSVATFMDEGRRDGFDRKRFNRE